MRRTLISPPAIEPVELEEAKLYCRITSDSEDALIESFIVTAREYVESYIQAALITQTWQFYFDADEDIFNNRFVKIPLRPLVSITSVKTYTDANVAVIYPPENYRLSGNRVLLTDLYEWPDTYRTTDSSEFTVVAGYGATAASVPTSIRLAMKMLVAQWYEKREALYDPTEGSSMGNVPFGVTALLAPYRNYFL